MTGSSAANILELALSRGRFAKGFKISVCSFGIRLMTERLVRTTVESLGGITSELIITDALVLEGVTLIYSEAKDPWGGAGGGIRDEACDGRFQEVVWTCAGGTSGSVD